MSPRKSPRLGELPVGVRVVWEQYLWRLQEHAAQELMACVGIAVGVALFFGVLAADTSVTGTAPQLVHQLVGSARFVLDSRSSDGFSESIANEAGQLPGVQVSSPLLKEQAVIVGPRSRQSVQVIGVTPSIVGLESEATRNLGAGAQLLTGGVGLPEQLAREVGARSGHSITLIAEGIRHTITVRDVLGTQTIGAVADSPIVVALLSTAQELTGKSARVTQVLIRPRAKRSQAVEHKLDTLAAGHLEVVSADSELRLLQEAAKPSNESTKLFAFIAVMVGFLLALNAVLITAPERRRSIAEMRLLGYRRNFIIVILSFQAIILGLAGSLLGIGLGYILSKTLFHQVPGFLASAFLLGSHPTIHLVTVLLAVGCGILAAFGASLPIMMDLRTDVTDAVLQEPGEAGQSITTSAIYGSAVVGVLLVAAVTAIIFLLPSLTIVGGVLLAIAALCFIPSAYSLVLRTLDHLSDNLPGSTLPIAVPELEATTIRSIALASIIALAVYGSIAVGGAQHDLLTGLDNAIAQEWGTAQVWITPDNNIFDADPFHSGNLSSTIARLPDVAGVRAHQGGFLDIGSHRLWIRAEPPNNSVMILSSQLLKGNLAHATALLRGRGWVTTSNGFAVEHQLHVGSRFTIPVPSGTATFSVAAITTNIGWPSGTITMNTVDYSHYWQTNNPTTIAINLRPGVTAQTGRDSVEKVLGREQGLRVQTSSERIAEVETIVRQGLRSLGEIATLLLIAAALAVASALSTSIWQRRRQFASLKALCFDSFQLWRAIIFECAVLLAIGGVDGTILGVYGHALASRWLKNTTGFPAPFSFAETQVLTTLVLVIGIALLVISLPGLKTARVPAQESFQE